MTDRHSLAPGPFRPEKFAARLREYRNRERLTQQELGRRIGLSEASAGRMISTYESGDVPYVARVVRLAQVLDIRLDYLLGVEPR